MKILILNRFVDIIESMLDSLEKFKLPSQDVIIVRDGHERDYGYVSINGDQPFIFSRNANLGINAAGEEDVFLANDDICILQEDFFDKLASVIRSLPKRVGILGALVDGGVGLAMQHWPPDPQDWASDKLYFVPYPFPVCFVAVWLRRAMLDDIGLLDEGYVHYGGDDSDLCMRARAAGWSCAVSREIWVRHGIGGNANIRGANWSQSFFRVDPLFSRHNIDYHQRKYFQMYRHIVKQS